MKGKGVKFERIRRITGYLVGTIDRFNDAKKAEEKDRVKHKQEVIPMANIENLVPNSARTPSQRRENATKAGIASGIARRRKSICNKLLNNIITSEEAKQELIKNGLDDDLSELAYSMYDLLRTSRDKKNEKTTDRLQALKMLMDYAGEEETQNNGVARLMVVEVDNSKLESAMYEKDES